MKMPWRRMALSEQKRVSEDCGKLFFLCAYDMEDTLMHFLVESCKEIRRKRSTTGNSKHMNAKHGKIGRIIEVDVHIISVRISFFQKSNQPPPVAFFRFTPCSSPDVHWHNSRRFLRLFTSDGIDDTAMFCLGKLAFGNKRITWILQSNVKFAFF